jgi:Chlamydia CHLPS protein (DUF818)
MAIKSINDSIFAANYPAGYQNPQNNSVVKAVSRAFFTYVVPVSYVVDKMIYPATFAPNRLYRKSTVEEQRSRIYEAGGEKVKFRTPDGITLKGIFLKGNARAEKVVIYCGGNGDFMGNMSKEIGDLWEKLGYSLFLFDPRGVNDFSKVTDEGLALDTYTAAEYLHNQKGFSFNNMIFYGFSLGGYRAVAGAALVQKAHPEAKINVINDRSFCSMKMEVMHLKGKHAASIVNFFGWECDTAAAWKEIKGGKIVIYDPQDEMIPFQAQLIQQIETDDGVKFINLESSKKEGSRHLCSFDLSEQGRLYFYILSLFSNK